MRCRVLALFLVSVLICLTVPSLTAQETEKMPELYLVEIAVVKPGMVEKHDAALKKMVEMCTEFGYPHPWYAYATSDFHYYYVFPIEGMSGMEKIFSDWNKVVQGFGEKEFYKFYQKYSATNDYYEYHIVRYRPELSYLKEEETSQMLPFVMWGFTYIIPGKENEMEDLFKKWVTLYKENDFPYGFETYTVQMGGEMPMIFYVERAKTAAHLFTMGDKIYEIAGKEVEALWMETLKLCRKYENKMGLFRSDLSYMPKKE